MPSDMSAQVYVNNDSVQVLTKRGEDKKSIAVAPGEGKIPTNIMREENMDVKAFPRHHPSGKFGLHYPRTVKLSPLMYFNQRLLNHDERFSRDAFYTFMASTYLERHSLERQIDISGFKGKSNTSGNGEMKVHLTDAFEVFKQVKGTPRYWQAAKYELVAKVKQLGPFHIFYTFSCGEMRWTECFLSLLKRKGCKTEYPDDWDGTDETILVEGMELWEYVDGMTDSRHTLFKDYIFLITRLFDARVKSFVKHILLGKGKGQIPIHHYSYRVEFQARGMPHIHGVGWIEKEWLENVYGITGDFIDEPEKALPLVDKLISCELPENNPIIKDIVNEVQRHHHTKSCQKYNGSCRYGFPKLPCPATVLAEPLSSDMDPKEKTEKMKKAKKILQDAKTLLELPDFDEKMTFDEFLECIDTNEEDYFDAIKISDRGKVLVLKRSLKERFINNYNPEMIYAWNANMDIQVAFDPYAVISYIANYMMKDENSTTPFLREVLNKSSKLDAKERLKLLKNTYLTHRQVGASEAVYKAISAMQLKDSNVKCVFVPTGFPENRSILYKRVKDESSKEADGKELQKEIIDEDEGDDDEVTEESIVGGAVKIEGKQGSFKQAPSIIDRYQVRPEILDQMCLAQFAIFYTPASTVPKKVEFENGSSKEKSNQSIFGHADKKLPRYIKLDGLGFMRLRSFPAVLRIHSSKKKEDYEKYYSELLLFCPWTSKESETEKFHRDNATDCINMYEENIAIIESNRTAIYPGEGTIDVLESDDLTIEKPLHIFDILDSQRQQENDDDMDVGVKDDPLYESFGYRGNLENQADNVQFEDFKYKKFCLPSDEEMKFFTHRLVPEQLNILRKVVKYCKDVVRSRKNFKHIVEPLRLIVHGGQGKILFQLLFLVTLKFV